MAHAGSPVTFLERAATAAYPVPAGQAHGRTKYAATAIEGVSIGTAAYAMVGSRSHASV
jgi:hypothetical protein